MTDPGFLLSRVGAAVRAGMIARDAGLNEMVMTDVAPFTLGIETLIQHGEHPSERSHGIFMPIIERNTVIPASRSNIVTTVENNQRAMGLRVFQGEASLVKDNVRLGELKIVLPPGPAGRDAFPDRPQRDRRGGPPAGARRSGAYQAGRALLRAALRGADAACRCRGSVPAHERQARGAGAGKAYWAGACAASGCDEGV